MLSLSHTGRDRHLLMPWFELQSNFLSQETGFIDAPSWIPCGGSWRCEPGENHGPYAAEQVTLRGFHSATR